MARQDTLPVISQIKIGDTLYNIRDKQAPEGALHLLGRTETAVTDGGYEAPTIGGKVIPIADLQVGDVVLYKSSGNNETIQEYVWIPSPVPGDAHPHRWELLGDEGSYVLKGTYTTNSAATGITVSAPSFTGTTEPITLNGTISGGDLPVEETTDTNVSAIDWEILPTATITSPTYTLSTYELTATGSYQPKGTISAPTFTGTEHTHSHIVDISMDYTPQHGGGLLIGEYKPAGTITTPTISSKTITIDDFSLPTGITITVNASGNYQPAGTVSKPNVNVDQNHLVTVVTGVTAAAGTTVTVYTANPTVSNEVLEFIASTVVSAVTGGTASGTASVLGSGTTVALASAPTFTGTTVKVSLVSEKYTPSADFSFTLTQPTFDGKIVYMETAEETITPSGTISAPTFTGTTETIAVNGNYKHVSQIYKPTLTFETITVSKRLIAKLSATSFSASGNYQPKGSVSAPTVNDPGHTHTISLA